MLIRIPKHLGLGEKAICSEVRAKIGVAEYEHLIVGSSLRQINTPYIIYSTVLYGTAFYAKKLSYI